MALAVAPIGSATAGAPTIVRARFSSYGLSFSYPAAWRRENCGIRQTSSFTMTIAFLTTSRSATGCPRFLPSGSVKNGGLPIRRLKTNGVLVDWSAFGMPGRGISKWPGKVARIGGRAARILVLRRGSSQAWRESICSRVGAWRAIEVAIARPIQDNEFTVDACIRGPNVSARESAVRHMLASVQIAIGH